MSDAIALLAVVLVVSYIVVNMWQPPTVEKKAGKTKNKNKGRKEIMVIYPETSIDIRALQAHNDVIVPTLEVDGMYLIMDQMEGVNAKVRTLYNLKKQIDSNLGNRGAYLLDQVHRDGNVIPVPFNRKTNLPTADFVGL